MTESKTATVEVLTAEVRVLMVGSRQITLSVYRQLDEVQPDEIKPFGRVRTSARQPFAAIAMIEVVGSVDGTLARSTLIRERYRCGTGSGRQMSRVNWNGQDAIILRCREHPIGSGGDGHFWQSHHDEWDEWEALPLIVLAGLR